MSGTNDAKRELRRRMRTVRREAADPAKSAAIVERIHALTKDAPLRRAMAFAAIPGEPDVGPLTDAWRARGVDVVMPAADPAAAFPTDPETLDLVVVPGVAFSCDGRRLGNGGGWYDRFLGGVRPECLTIGVCFDEQLVDDVPVEPHDRRVDWIVTPTTTVPAGGTAPTGERRTSCSYDESSADHGQRS